jgi:hypothetical protein
MWWASLEVDLHGPVCKPWVATYGVMSHPNLRDKAGCVSYVRQRRTLHIMTKCIDINVTNIIIT